VINNNAYKITNPHERLLASVLIKFTDIVESVSEQLAINWLCDYIYEVCVRISENYSKVILSLII
jgi:arginyl-tRNA synthetase